MVTAQPHVFDDDPAGAILEYGYLLRKRDDQRKVAWVEANIRRRVPGAWTTPAMSKSHLASILGFGRDEREVRRKLDWVWLKLASEYLIEPHAGDDNFHTQFRDLSVLGAELLEARAYIEYLGGLPTVVSRWLGSVVKIFHPTEKGIGTGFLVGPRTIATARHVVDGISEFVVACEDKVGLPYARVRRYPDEKVDVAVIDLVADAPMRPFTLSNSHSLMEEVVVMGYPPIPLSSDAFLVANRGEIGAEVKLLGGEHQVLVVSCLLRGGNSGGPVVNRRGAVVGIVSRNLEAGLEVEGGLNEGLGYAAAFTSEWIQDLTR